MTYSIVLVLTALTAAGGSLLLLRLLSGTLAMKELGIKPASFPERKHPTAEEYAPRCGGLLPSAAMFAAAAAGIILYSLLAGGSSPEGIPRLSGLQSAGVLGGLLLAPLCGAAGFMEDYARVFRRVEGGVRPWQSVGLKAVIAAGYLAVLWLAGDGGEGVTTLPFAGQVRLGFAYYPLSLLLITAIVHGAQLLHEAEGAVPSVGFFSFIPCLTAAGLAAAGSASLADSGLMAAAGACGCLVFMVYNFTPARSLCGAAGGAFAGALLCGVHYAWGTPVLLLLTGSVYLAQSLTALAGWLTGRITGRKPCPPLHRLLGRRGKNDVQITVILAGTEAVLCAVAAALALFGAR